MNEREIAEIRRRFRPDKSNITHVRGCYVNEKKEIISEFYQSMALLPQAESEELLTILKKTLSGTVGKNLIDITFDTQQVVSGDEHRLLMALRGSSLRDDDAARAFFQQAVQSLTLEGGYLILLTCDTYDIPYKGRDGDDFAEASSEVYSYILCSVCPVKLTKPALSFHAHENAFCHLGTDWVVSPPELGFLFPAFDGRSTNLYNALYYCRNTAENYKDFVEAVFRSSIPMPAAVQKETFQSILGQSLEEDCRYEVVQAVQDHLCGMITEHKQNKVREPLVLSKNDVRRVLTGCGVSEGHADAFSQQYDQSFGPGAELSPRNLVDTKQTEVHIADVKIQFNPQRGDLVQTRIIDGEQYLLIRAGEGVEVNGVPVHIS